MNPVQEILGAVNYWVNSSGGAYSVQSHVEWACKQILKIKVPMTFVTDNVYQQMYRKGWMRIAILGDRINVDFAQMTRQQADWLQNECNVRQRPAITDRNRTIMEPEIPPEMAESIVRRLLGEAEQVTLDQLGLGSADEDELIWQFIGRIDLKKPLSVHTMEPRQIARLKGMERRRHATRDQRAVIGSYAKQLGTGSLANDIIVVFGDQLVDGHHRAAAALRARRPLRYVDLADLD